MAIFDAIIIFILLFLTFLFFVLSISSGNILVFTRSTQFIWIVVGYIATIVSYIVIGEVIERYYE